MTFDPKGMRDLALTGLDNDVRKTLLWAADEIVRLAEENALLREDNDVLHEIGNKCDPTFSIAFREWALSRLNRGAKP